MLVESRIIAPWVALEEVVAVLVRQRELGEPAVQLDLAIFGSLVLAQELQPPDGALLADLASVAAFKASDRKVAERGS